MRPARNKWSERAPTGRLEVSQRDMDLLETLHRYRFLPTSLLMDRFFTSKSFADRRLRKLYDHGLVDRILRPVVEGRPELIHTLGPAGARLLARSMGISTEELKWSKSKRQASTRFLDHELEVNRFHFLLESAALETAGYMLEEWRERGLLPQFPSSARPVPDAYFRLLTPRGTAQFFLEVDLGNEAATSVFKRKLVAYKTYGESGAFRQEFGGEYFRVLTTVPNEVRLKTLKLVVASVGMAIIFWFAIQDDIRKNTILGPLWRRSEQPSQFFGL